MPETSQFNYRKILLAVDGSEHSRAAVHFLRDLSLQPEVCKGCNITVLGVMLPRDAGSYSTYLIPLNKAEFLLREQGFHVEKELLTGYPAEVILNYAQEKQPEMIVVGAKGLRATLGILLGGVAQQIVEYACCPVLVIRAPYRRLKRVLLVTDGSIHSQHATKYLANFPLPNETDVEIMHVLPPPPLIEPQYLMRVWSISDEAIQHTPVISAEEYISQQAEERSRGQAILDQCSELLAELRSRPKLILQRGDAATEIIQHAKENNIDLIVSGSRGLSQMQSWLLGSVSRKLIHYSGCSVLIVKSKSTTEEGDYAE